MNLITAREIAQMCRTSPRVVAERWAYRPDFPPALKPGRQKLWERDAVLAWVRRQRA